VALVLLVVVSFFVSVGSDIVFTSVVVLFEVMLGYSIFQWSTRLCIRELDCARCPVNNGVALT